MAGCLIAAKAAAHFNSAGSLNHPVQQDQIGDILTRHDKRFVAVGRAPDIIAFILEAVLQQFRQCGIVFNEQ